LFNFLNIHPDNDLKMKEDSYPMEAHQNANLSPSPSIPSMVNMVEPFVYQGLQSLVNKCIVVEAAVKGSVQGRLLQVFPDHIVLESYGVPFYIRIQQIVWITPARD
jgi:hypothetical protein